MMADGLLWAVVWTECLCPFKIHMLKPWPPTWWHCVTLIGASPVAKLTHGEWQCARPSVKKASPSWYPCAAESASPAAQHTCRPPDVWGRKCLYCLHCFKPGASMTWSWKHRWCRWLSKDWLLQLLLSLLPKVLVKIWWKTYSYNNDWPVNLCAEERYKAVDP